MSKKPVLSAAAALGLAASALLFASPTASAGAPSCYGQAVNYSTTVGFWPLGTGYATTSQWCSDINVKPSKTIQVQVCFPSTGACNGFRTITGGTWGVAASNVIDGTDYWLDFGDTVSSGQVAD
jgi:hypothetical protein